MSIASYLAGLLNSSGLVPVSKLNTTGTPSSSNFLRGDGTWNTPVTLAYNRQVFNASGTWNNPGTGTYVIVQIWGSGAGGKNGGGGGGGGGYSSTTFLLSDLGGSNVSVTINSGGTSGADGGSITFGSYLTHSGGSTGATQTWGCTTTSRLGASGRLSASSGLTLIDGKSEFSLGGSISALSAGLAAGSQTQLVLGPSNMFAPGSGQTQGGAVYNTAGSSVFGGAGGGGSGGSGSAGTAPGGGGGSGSSTSGAGAIGRVIVTVF